jgi:hypothetical protein
MQIDSVLESDPFVLLSKKGIGDKSEEFQKRAEVNSISRVIYNNRSREIYIRD